MAGRLMGFPAADPENTSDREPHGRDRCSTKGQGTKASHIRVWGAIASRVFLSPQRVPSRAVGRGANRASGPPQRAEDCVDNPRENRTGRKKIKTLF